MTRALTAAAVLLFALAGCSSTVGQSQQPGASSDSGSATAPDGQHIRAGDEVFDVAVDDVAGTEVCDGIAGSDALATFDRAAWPALDVAAGEAVMTCGNASGAGWRHIADGHTGDYQELADLVDAGWEDVAWFAIDEALENPTNVEEYRDGIVNYDVLVEFVGASGDTEREWMVTVGVGLDTGTIITSFPDER